MLLDTTTYNILMSAAGVLALVVMMLIPGIKLKLSLARDSNLIGSILLVVVFGAGLIFDKWFAPNVYSIEKGQKEETVLRKKVLVGTTVYNQGEIRATLNSNAYQCHVINHTDKKFQVSEMPYTYSSEISPRHKFFQKVKIAPHTVQPVKVVEIDYFPGEEMPVSENSESRTEVKYLLDYDQE